MKILTPISIDNLMTRLFFFFCFFPYFAPLALPSDLQPYAFIISFYIFFKAFLRCRGLPRLVWLLVIPPIVALYLTFINGESFFALRAFFSYLSLFTITAATYFTLQVPEYRLILRKFIHIATYVWIIAGIIELFEPHIFSIIISNISIDADRGVVGLATEPSFYGIYCFTLIFLNYLVNDNNRKICFLLIAQIFLLAQSSITIIFFAIIFFYWIIFFFSFRAAIILIATTIVVALLFNFVKPEIADTRISFLAIKLFEDPFGLVADDVSINARIGHILFSLHGFIDNLGAPFGFGVFQNYVQLKLIETDFQWLGFLGPGLKIMSGYGGALFELGIFGLLIIYVFSVSITRYFQKRIRYQLFFLFAINTIMLAAIQLSLPFIGVILGVLILGSEHQINRRKST